jgi:two-component system response regulator RegA
MKVLLIEDDQFFASTLELEFSDLGHQFTHIETPTELHQLQDEITHAIVDLRVKSHSGIDFIPIIKEKFPNCYIVMLTAFGSIASTVDAIKLGADDYITKPVTFDLLYQALKNEKKQSSETETNSLARNEREYIEFILKQHGGNISQAAKTLGIHRQSLQRKLKKYTPN